MFYSMLPFLFLHLVSSFQINYPLSNDIRVNYLKTHTQKLSVLFETREAQNESSTDPFAENDGDSLSVTKSRFSVSLPAIHYTVPNYKIGWQDESGKWFDEDGERNGPPQNYWRQMADERSYKVDMDALSSVTRELNVEEVVLNLEKRNGVRRPSLSRKLLGSWAPVIQDGKKIIFNDVPFNDDLIETLFKIDIYRSAGRKFAPRTYYGLFDAKLDDGEELTIETTNSLHKNILASSDNKPISLGTVVDDDGNERHFSLGKITYLSDYILVHRNKDGAINFWLRCDDYYLGLNDDGSA